MSGFDCPDHYADHCFLVRIPRSSVEPVAFLEVFGRRPTVYERQWAPECVLRATLPREVWNHISGEVRVEFNAILKAEGKKPGKWSIGHNGVQRLLGKELVLLAWAIDEDDVTETDIQAAIRNWRGLKREERWWMYTMTAASTGYSSDRGKGWRKAVRAALTFAPNRDGDALVLLGERNYLAPRPNEDFSGVVKRDPQKEDTHLLRAFGGFAFT